MTEKQKHFVAEVHQDRTKIRLSMGKEELELSAEDLDTLIRELGQRRTMMTPPVPMALEPNPRFAQIPNPPWQMGVVNKEEKIIVLLMRHPAYGWFGNLFHIDMAKRMIEGLGQTIRAIEPVQLPKKQIILPPGH